MDSPATSRLRGAALDAALRLHSDLMTEARAIIDLGNTRGVVVRLTGGLAVRHYAIDLEFAEREYSDIDLIGLKRQVVEIGDVFRELGYVENKHVAMATGNGLTGKPSQLVERALKIDPQHPHSLFLAGAAAMEAGNNKKGIAYWEALLPQVEPGSEIDQMLRSGIDKMKQAK